MAPGTSHAPGGTDAGEEDWGVVQESAGGMYQVLLPTGEAVAAMLRGRVKRTHRTGDRVVAGDRVRIEPTGEDGAVIEEVAPRDSQIVRRGRGGRARVVAANVDRMIAVVAAEAPPASTGAIDRLLVIGESDELDVALVFNKIDLLDDDPVRKSEVLDELVPLYRSIGYPVLSVSAHGGEGVGDFATLVCDGVSALVGPSGVGKSSLLNAVEPGLDLRIGELSRRIGRGRHTTVSSRLIPLGCGGLVADTPGFGEVGVWGGDPDQVGGCFPEIRSRAGACRFADCAHLEEPGCAVREAVEEGEVAASRYRSYRALREEMAEGR